MQRLEVTRPREEHRNDVGEIHEASKEESRWPDSDRPTRSLT